MREVEISRKFREELIEDKKRLANWSMVQVEKWGSIAVDGVSILAVDYQQIGQAIVESIVEPNFQEWRIEKICVFDGDYWSRNAGSSKFGWGYKEWEIALIHRDFVARYDNHGELIKKDGNGGKIHYKSAFANGMWRRVESFVKSDPQLEKENGQDNSQNYKSWTKEQLISEINLLKAENEELKKSQTLTNSERQERLQQNQRKLEKLELENSKNIYSQPNNSKNGFPTSWVVGGALLVIVLVSFLVIKNAKKIKKQN